MDLLPVAEVLRRLERIIPPEVDPRGWARREMAARTIFVMLYGFAVEGRDRWIRPTAVTDMTDPQAAEMDPGERSRWLELVQSSRRPRDLPGRWYRENTREPIRDETIRTLVSLGAIVERPGVSTTSSQPRYALSRSFAELFSVGLSDGDLESAIREWQERNLSAAARARISLLRRRAGAQSQNVLVTLPTGEARTLSPGPSATLSKAVVEEFATRFLLEPAVVVISESAHKLHYLDDAVARDIGFRIDPSRSLPDVLLVDLGAQPPLVVFVECVVTDGAVTEPRKRDLEHLAMTAGYPISGCAFVTAFHDRVTSPFARLVKSLAWNTFAWFETEPESLIFLRQGHARVPVTLESLLRLKSSG